MSIENFLEYKRDTSKYSRFTNDWTELYFLRQNLNEVAAFLLRLKHVPVRHVVIMRKELIGFSKNELYTHFRLNNNQMTSFTDTSDRLKQEINFSTPLHQSLEGRQVVSDIHYPSEFLAFISLLSRLPLQWLILPEPDLVWSIDHFALLNDVSLNYSKREFSTFLNGLDHNSHDVRAVIITDKVTKTKLYLRVEHLFGTLSIELCNINASNLEYESFIDLFQGENYYKGLMPTVISSQINHTVVMRHVLCKRPLCYPVEFIAIPPSLY
ncbi:hypothetical protein [Paenibacillus albidus]|nr:hypothetical protein [Paenibacillus albidus]